MSNLGAIGFIDSGVGGLTVVKEALRQLPNEKVIYLGDTARCPYGPRPVEQVIQYTREMTQFLLERNIKMLVIACNTATAVALDILRKEIDIPVIGVILPGSSEAIKRTVNNKIAVIGTEGTVASHAYGNTITGKSPDTEVIELACPKFVPIVESKKYASPLAKMVVAETLKPLKEKKVDCLVLGCTHYPLLRPLIQNVMGSDVSLIDSGAETVDHISMLLDYFEIAAPAKRNDLSHEFYATGSVVMFEEIASDWLGLSNVEVKKAKIEKDKKGEL
ncbi:glutamate racemase [Vagococcus sp. PNs007]|uniref:Glutamate racemase n=1 Tax=Vagococcus proximus TaxID=2991417 RepID=A0ABT5X2R0_9ENTE|nr:glutamate racemase [Vagococcus proximus]MDF0480286.1 glutamate racemase [Vagococcus proximus]